MVVGVTGVVSNNQTQLPLIQTDDATVTQLQQNANKVLRNLNNQIVDLETFMDQMTIVGEIKIANLTTAQFQSVAGTNWILSNGQSSVGTAYSLLTGNNTVPNLTVGGINTFIRVN